MIEGIVGIFVILFLILVVPYIKDFFREKTVTSIKVFPSESTPPINGDVWFSTDDGKTRVWRDNQWVVMDGPPKNPQAGDVWFY
jgi:hypothetical protein